MSDQSPAGVARSRGRARGRAQPPSSADEAMQSMQSMRISPTGSSSGNGNGNGSDGNGSNGNGNGSGNGSGNGDGAAQRGRGGYRGAHELDTRPENVKTLVGTIGSNIKLLSNYIEMRTPENIVVNNFDVKFEPDIEAIKLRRTLIYGLEFLERPFLFDGVSNIKALVWDKEDKVFFCENPTAEGQIKITIKWTEEIPWGSLEMLRLFNTQMRRNLQLLGYSLMGRQYFDSKSRKTIPDHKIELMSGLLTAIAQHDGGILMVVDTTTKFIRSETVLQLISSIRKSSPSDWLDEAKRQLCGFIVLTQYNNRTYKIDDLATGTNFTPQTMKFEKNGRMMTLIEYYREQYSIEIRVPNQPLIECLPSSRDRRAGRTAKLYLVPELCQMTGLTDDMRKDFNCMKKIADYSRHPPTVRVKSLNAFVANLNANPKVKEEMETWQLEYGNKLVEINGRVLPCEKIYTGGDDDITAKAFDQKSGDFSREMRSKGLVRSPSLNKWMLILTKQDEVIVNEFVTTMKRVSRPMGFILGDPKINCLNNDRPSTFVTALQNLKGSPCQMVVCIVPNNNKDRYDSIKKICYCEEPMPSQVVVGKTLYNKTRVMSVCTKIAIQMVTKLGGEPWTLKIPAKELMVVGYDTYHDSSDSRRSVGGFVCSLNPTLTTWYSRASYHTDKDEMSSNFAINFREGIKRYFDVRKTLPVRIVVYRDGVGEGMIQHVFDFELKQIQDELFKISAENPPKLSFVIVTKRVNARFFTSEGTNQNNPIPGTVVDSTVTRLKRYDFYLISQSVRQGTVTPTMYNIIHDSTGFKPEHHQQLAYKLTHLYFNWPGTIRVPAPCQYAHKLAFLTGTSLHREPNTMLSGQLFYL